MADFVVGISDGYHSIAFAGGLEPATRQAFSITSPSVLQNADAKTPSGEPALAEVFAGAIANIKT
ncbi:MAG: hypothetical protein AB9872_15375 [Solidesulfovibrio sp.]